MWLWHQLQRWWRTRRAIARADNLERAVLSWLDDLDTHLAEARADVVMAAAAERRYAGAEQRAVQQAQRYRRLAAQALRDGREDAAREAARALVSAERDTTQAHDLYRRQRDARERLQEALNLLEARRTALAQRWELLRTNRHLLTARHTLTQDLLDHRAEGVTERAEEELHWETLVTDAMTTLQGDPLADPLPCSSDPLHDPVDEMLNTLRAEIAAPTPVEEPRNSGQRGVRAPEHE